MPDKLMVVSEEELTTGQFLPPEMVADLRAIVAIEAATIDNFTRALTAETGVLTEEELRNSPNDFSTMTLLNPCSEQYRLFSLGTNSNLWHSSVVGGKAVKKGSASCRMRIS